MRKCVCASTILPLAKKFSSQYLPITLYTFEKGKWYVTCKFIKSNEKNTEDVIKYGLLNNYEYNEYLLKYEDNIIKRIPWTSFRAKIKAILKYKELNDKNFELIGLKREILKLKYSNLKKDGNVVIFEERTRNGALMNAKIAIVGS